MAESPTDNTLSASPTKLREVPPMVMLEVVTPALTAWELEPKATLPSTVATVFAPNATALAPDALAEVPNAVALFPVARAALPIAIRLATEAVFEDAVAV